MFWNRKSVERFSLAFVAVISLVAFSVVPSQIAHASGVTSCVGFSANTAGTYQCQWPSDGSSLNTTVTGVGGSASLRANGGSGSKVQTTLNVAGNSILTIVVGAGVAPATGTVGSATAMWGKGGNLSSIYLASTPLVIAGGGGGAGGGTSDATVAMEPGGSAYNSASPGSGSTAYQPSWSPTGGGKGGTQSAYGAGGTNSGGAAGAAGTSAGPGYGGIQNWINTSGRGGQGGWGYFSGGGGSAYNNIDINGLGGGGGSSYSAGTATVYSDALNGGVAAASPATTSDGSVSFSGTPVNVTYNTNGGTAVTTTYSYSGGVLTTPTTPTKAGAFTFSGWSTDAAGYNLVTFPYTVSQNSDFTLYAQYYQAQTATASSTATTIKYGKNNTVTLSVNLSTVDGKVTFYYNNKPIYKCVNIVTSSLVASCQWKPTVHGLVQITALATSPNNQFIPTFTSTPVTLNIPKR